jgi:hypothetical protein
MFASNIFSSNFNFFAPNELYGQSEFQKALAARRENIINKSENIFDKFL